MGGNWRLKNKLLFWLDRKLYIFFQIIKWLVPHYSHYTDIYRFMSVKKCEYWKDMMSLKFALIFNDQMESCVHTHKALEEIRTPFINKLRGCLIDIIRPNLIQELLDNSGNLLQLIIDCSRFHFLSLNQQHRIEKIAAGLCFNLHQKRASLLL